MTADLAGTMALAVELDEPEQLLRYLKQLAIKKAETIQALDAFAAAKWDGVAEGLADIETELSKLKPAPGKAKPRRPEPEDDEAQAE
jgi:hypothetical protein